MFFTWEGKALGFQVLEFRIEGFKRLIVISLRGSGFRGLGLERLGSRILAVRLTLVRVRYNYFGLGG